MDRRVSWIFHGEYLSRHMLTFGHGFCYYESEVFLSVLLKARGVWYGNLFGCYMVDLVVIFIATALLKRNIIISYCLWLLLRAFSSYFDIVRRSRYRHILSRDFITIYNLVCHKPTMYLRFLIMRTWQSFINFAWRFYIILWFELRWTLTTVLSQSSCLLLMLLMPKAFRFIFIFRTFDFMWAHWTR